MVEPRTGYFTDCTSSTTCFLNLTCTDKKCICPSSQGYNPTIKNCGNFVFSFLFRLFHISTLVNCKSGWFGYDERCYQGFKPADTWDNAKAKCVSLYVAPLFKFSVI